MTLVALTMSGWLAAAVALLVAAVVRRGLNAQREAAVRAAHELRGPLTAIGLGLELDLEAVGGGDPIRHALELELSRARLVLEDLSGQSRRRLTVNLDRLDLAELVSACVEAAAPRARRAGVAVTTRLPSDSVHVWGDRLRLAQVIGNLIANALEHGAGTVEVRCSANGAIARIEVCDQGPGLPAPVAEIIRGAEGGRGRRGRGLAIAADIAERHRGRLAGAPSERGARLVLELPAA